MWNLNLGLSNRSGRPQNYKKAKKASIFRGAEILPIGGIADVLGDQNRMAFLVTTIAP